MTVRQSCFILFFLGTQCGYLHMIIHYSILIQLTLLCSCFRNVQIAAILDQKNYVEELNRQLK